MNLLPHRPSVMKSKPNRVFLFISHNTESDTNAVNVLQFYFVDNSLYVSKEKSVFVENDSKRVTFFRLFQDYKRKCWI